MSTVRCGQSLTGQPRGDGGAPLCLPGAVRRRIHVECRRAHPAAHVGRVLGGGDDPARSAPSGPPPACSERVLARIRPDRSVARRRGEGGGEQFGRGRGGYLGRGRRSGRRPDDQVGFGHIQPGIEQAGDDADQPRVACRSAAAEDQRSLRGAPGAPEAVEVRGEWRRPVVFMGVAFRELPVGRSRWRLPQSRDRGLQGSAHWDTAFMGLTSCRRITIAKTLARRRRRECCRSSDRRATPRLRQHALDLPLPLRPSQL